MIGTIKINDGSGLKGATHTTPGAIEMQSILKTMKENRCKAVTMENVFAWLRARALQGNYF